MNVFDSLPALHADKGKRSSKMRAREDKQSLEQKLSNDPNMIKLDKPDISASAIRKKVAEKNAGENAEAASTKKAMGPDKFDFPMDKAKEEADVAASDIKDNNTASAVTQEKLKNVLSTGGFNFSDKERQVLGNILKDS
jgi:hypothetical protein